MSGTASPVFFMVTNHDGTTSFRFQLGGQYDPDPRDSEASAEEIQKGYFPIIATFLVLEDVDIERVDAIAHTLLPNVALIVDGFREGKTLDEVVLAQQGQNLDYLRGLTDQQKVIVRDYLLALMDGNPMDPNDYHVPYQKARAALSAELSQHMDYRGSWDYFVDWFGQLEQQPNSFLLRTLVALHSGNGLPGVTNALRGQYALGITPETMAIAFSPMPPKIAILARDVMLAKMWF